LRQMPTLLDKLLDNAMMSGKVEECFEHIVAGANWNPPDIDQVNFIFRRNLYRLYRDLSIRLHDLWSPLLRPHVGFDSLNITLEYLGCQHESRQQEQRREEEVKRLAAWRLQQVWAKPVAVEDVD